MNTPLPEATGFDVLEGAADFITPSAEQTEVILENIGLVSAMAWRFHGQSYDRHDFEQTGHLGQMQAVQTFDPAKGKFEDHVARRARGAMQDAIRTTDHMIRPIRRDSTAQAKVKAAVACLNDGVSRVDDAKIAALTNMSEVDVRHYRHAPRVPKVESIFKPVMNLAHGGPPVELIDLLVGTPDHADTIDTVADVHRYLDELPQKLAAVLRCRYGLTPHDQPRTQMETSVELGISRSAVYRREKAAKNMMRLMMSATE